MINPFQLIACEGMIGENFDLRKSARANYP
jgi:hypothetical protein